MINWEMYKKLLQTPGVPGFEHEVRKVLKSYLSNYTDEFLEDRLGGIFGVKKGGEGPKVMVAGHMDEVGFMIKEITEDGFLKFETLGGWWSQVLLSQRVDIVNRKGQLVTGVIGSAPPHLLSQEKRNKVTNLSEMYIDVGAASKYEVKDLGIMIGDTAVPHSPFVEMYKGKRLLSKAWDNRFGCGIAVELLKEFDKDTHPNTLYSGATVQEEVGLRGAQVAANLVKPDMCFAIDCGPAGDTPHVNGLGKLGKGVVIRILDRTVVTLPNVRDYLLDIAESHNIPYQFFVSQGGTDAGNIHVSGIGVPSVCIGICGRYIHSHTTIVDKEDIEACKEFSVNLIKGLNQSTYNSIINY